MNKCKVCNRDFIYERKKGGTRDKCNSCHVNERRFKLKMQMVEHMGGGCSRCGYNKCMGALTFHHLDPSTKLFQLSGSHSRSWASIEKELAKCVLLCQNCHSEEHHNCSKSSCG